MEDKNSTNAASKEEVIKIMKKDIEEHFIEETNQDKMQHIYDILTEYNELDSIKKYEKVKESIIESIEDNEEELLELLIGEEIQYKSGFSIKINKINKEASLFNIDQDFNNFTVPRTIQYNNENYLVTSIIGCRNLIGTLQFEENSAVHTIYKNAFRWSRIKEIYIPANLRIIKEGCFFGNNELKKIKVSPNNDRFLYQDDQYLFSKTDEKSDKYDILLFARRDIPEATIPSNIKIISSHAFYNCKNLVKVTIEENSKLEIIGKSAFSSSNIKEIYIPANLRIIKEGCFCRTNELKNIKISPKNDRFLYQDDQYLLGKTDEKSENYDVLLYARLDISEATIPSNIKIISSYAFDGCENLRKVTIEENSKLEIIGKSAFSWSNIEEIYIPSNVSIISDGAFSFCENLVKVTIKENSKLENIGKSAFSYSNIEEIYIPSNVSIISDGTFYFCKNLVKVTIEENSKLEIIGEWAFSSSNIEEIYIPSNVSIISNGAFSNCQNLVKVTIEENSKLEIICEWAFSSSNIEEIYIPDNLRIIKKGCFCCANKLKKIKISPKNDRFIYQDDQYLVGKTDEKSENYDVLLFARLDISEATIPSNIKIISSCAFYKCKNLRKVTTEEKSKLEIIGEEAFSESNIEEVYIPANLRIIKEGCFYCANELKKIKISPKNDRFLYQDEQYLLGKTDEKSDKYDVLLYARRDISEATIPSNIKIISSYAFDGCKNLEKVTIEENSKLEIIGKSAFSYSNIEEIYIPSNVSIISDGAFYPCKELKIVEISEESQLDTLNDLFLDLDENTIIMVPVKMKSF